MIYYYIAEKTAYNDSGASGGIHIVTADEYREYVDSLAVCEDSYLADIFARELSVYINRRNINPDAAGLTESARRLRNMELRLKGDGKILDKWGIIEQ